MEKHLNFLFNIALCLILPACRQVADEVQTNSYETVQISQQLSNLRISGITQDSCGYIWMSTYRGLNRYNGHEMHQYFCDDTPESLPDNQTWDVYCDHTGRVWVATKNGVAYYTEQDNFHQVQMPASSQLSQKVVENRRGEIFVLQPHQVLRFDSKTDSFVEVVCNIPVNGFNGNNLFIDNQDLIWIVTPDYIHCYNPNNGNCIDKLDIANAKITTAQLIGDDLWIGDINGFKVYDVAKRQWKDLNQTLNKVLKKYDATPRCIVKATDSHMLIGTNKGLFDYNMASNEILHERDTYFPLEAPDFNVTRIFVDKENNLWFCSETQGYAVLPISKLLMNLNGALRKTFAGKPVSALAFDKKETLWIATQQAGLYSYNTRTQAITQHLFEKYRNIINATQITPTSLLVDSQGFLWAACLPYGLLKFNPHDNTCDFVDAYSIKTPIVLGEDANHTIWAGTYSNAYYSKRAQDSHFEEHHILSNTFVFISCLEQLHDGRMATLSKNLALRFIDQEKLELQTQYISDEAIDSCIARSVFIPTSLREDHLGNLWIGTVSNGLMHLDMQSKRLTNIPGAPCADIASIEEDEEGNIWVSTQYGIGKYDTESKQFTTQQWNSGLGGNEYYDRVSCKLPDGTLIFGGVHGLSVFNPRVMEQVPEKTSLHFEDLRIHNQLVRPGVGKPIGQQLSSAQTIKLNHNQNSFGITFSAIDFEESPRYNYSYKLENYNRQWVETNANEAFFANLRPGKYHLHVQARSKSSNQVVAQQSISIIIDNAPWASWWAKIIYLLLAVGILLILFRLFRRIRAERKDRLQAERQKEHEKRINDMNMSFFANVSHEFRAPLTIISGPVNQLVGDPNLPADARNLLAIVQHSVTRMLRLVNQMMDFHKLEDDALCLEVQRLDIIQLLKHIIEPFRLNAHEKNQTLTTKGIEDTILLWLDADKVEKVLYNLIGNAIKYTPEGGSISVSVDVIDRAEAAQRFTLRANDKNSQFLQIEVADNGNGIPADKLDKIFERYYQLKRQQTGQFNWGTGIGLYYSKKLVSLHHGYIMAYNQPTGTGSIFCLLLPTSEASYTDNEKCLANPSQINLYPIAEAPNTLLETTQSAEENEDKPTVLVVDDDVEIVHYMKTMLQSKYNVLCRFDVDSAMELLSKHEPDVILSDVMMPGRDGYDFCHQVKNDIQLCHIPVVLITAKTTTSDQIKGLDSGANAYVTKPFNPQYLLALVENLLNNREKVKHILGESTQTKSIEEDVLSPQDNLFMTELFSIMENELQNPDLDVAHITEMLHISRTKLYYKVKGLTGQNPSVFFKTYKLNRAAELIKEGRYNMSEISDLTGFSSLSHFSASFKKQFGVSPSEYK